MQMQRRRRREEGHPAADGGGQGAAGGVLGGEERRPIVHLGVEVIDSRDACNERPPHPHQRILTSDIASASIWNNLNFWWIRHEM